MIYKGPFKDIIYPAQSREPRVGRYRIVLAKNPRLVRAIVHLVADEPLQPQRTDLLTALDVVLNRIIDKELTGIGHDCMRLVVQSHERLIDYPIGFNALEVKRPRDAANRPPGTADEPVHIRSHDVVGGAAAFYVDQDEGKPASAIVERLLR
ncbi:hypothetical protein BZM27_51295 [Paraburkholderia steynii]|uniref:Uncharacterized protein n=1 Tax=Paraburkholderia steynii TaxID=1245441 RepID=A0A4V2NG01_9BURK|nr:hypothetical protein BZM27_51295 [Paraburkholderia steynii]